MPPKAHPETAMIVRFRVGYSFVAFAHVIMSILKGRIRTVTKPNQAVPQACGTLQTFGKTFCAFQSQIVLAKDKIQVSFRDKVQIQGRIQSDQPFLKLLFIQILCFHEGLTDRTEVAMRTCGNFIPFRLKIFVKPLKIISLHTLSNAL